MERNRFFEELNRKVGVSPPAERMGVMGAVNWRLVGPDGQVKQKGEHTNLVTSIGDMYLAQLVAFVAGATVGSVAYATLGVSTIAALKGDTDVLSAVAASSRGISATYPQRVASHVGAGEWTLWRFEWAAGASTNGSLGEVGLFSSVGSFVARAILTPNVNKGTNDSLQVDWGWKFLGA